MFFCFVFTSRLSFETRGLWWELIFCELLVHRSEGLFNFNGRGICCLLVCLLMGLKELYSPSIVKHIEFVTENLDARPSSQLEKKENKNRIVCGYGF